MRFPTYKSSIPGNAKARIIKRYPNAEPEEAEYRVKSKVVGVRLLFVTGEPEMEYGLKEGERHGMKYVWHSPGVLASAEPFVNGLAHGTTRQWDENGKLLGTYTMFRGTGIDLWRQQRGNGTVYLSEVWHYKYGKLHGFEWWLGENQKTVWWERHWQEGQEHGIEREWNNEGRLSRGYPRYYVSGERVTKRQYLSACRSDPSLPPFRPADNKPARRFPAEVACLPI
jgi:antitoxin component YwqK of YwqJK toxin-antitoxin module